MDPGAIETAIGVFGVTGGAVSTLVGYRVAKRRDIAQATSAEATAANTFTKTALELLEPVRQAAAESERRANAFLKQVAELEAIVASLTTSLTQMTDQATAERERADRRLLQAKTDCALETARLRDLLTAREKELSELRDRGAV